jgi:hypothetical protein
VSRDQYAAKIMAGFCANPAIFAPNGMCGWSLVNCTDADLVGYAFSLADLMVEAEGLTAKPTNEEAGKEGV